MSYAVLTRSPFTREPDSGITISTIHKSKGLEFDTVYVLPPSSRWDGQPDETRVVYVAATRAKNSIALLERDSRIFQWADKKKPKFGRFNHFHRFDKTTRNNYLLLDGLSGIDLGSLLSPPVHNTQDVRSVVLENQRSMWQVCNPKRAQLRVWAMDSRWIVEMLDGESSTGTVIGTVSQALERDLNDIGSCYGVPAIGLAGIEVVELAAVCFFDIPASLEVLGEAKLGLVPVVQSEAVVIVGEEVQHA